MRAARLPSIVVVVAVVVAGCSGPVADATPGGLDSTPTPAGGTPTPTGGAPTVTSTPSVPPDADLPPGVNRSGLVDRERLLAAFGAALNRTDAYRVHATRRVVLASGETTRPMNRTVHRGAVRGWEVLRLRETTRALGAPLELFARGPAVVQRNVAGDDDYPTYEYRYRATGDGRVAAGEDVDGPLVLGTTGPSLLLQYALSTGDFRVANVSDGAVTLVGTGPTSGTDPATATASAVDATGYAATLVVTSAGVVRHFEGTVTRSDGSRVEFSYAADLDVEPPSAPDWVADVPQPVPTTNANGTVLAIEHRAGPALAEGTSLSVGITGPDGPVSETDLALPERLEPSGTGDAEAAYVYAVETPDGVDLRTSAARPATNASFVDLSGGDVVVTHFGDRVQFELRLEPADEE